MQNPESPRPLFKFNNLRADHVSESVVLFIHCKYAGIWHLGIFFYGNSEVRTEYPDL